MLRSPLRGPAVQCSADRLAAVGVDRELVVPAICCRSWWQAERQQKTDGRRSNLADECRRLPRVAGLSLPGDQLVHSGSMRLPRSSCIGQLGESYKCLQQNVAIAGNIAMCQQE